MRSAPSRQCLAFLRRALDLGSARPQRHSRLAPAQRRAYGSLALATEELDCDDSLDVPRGILSALASGTRTPPFDRSRRLRHIQRHCSLPVERLRTFSSAQLQHLLQQCRNLKANDELCRLFETYFPPTKRRNVLPSILNLYLQALSRLSRHDDLELARFQLVSESARSSYDTQSANILLHHLISLNRLTDAIQFVRELDNLSFPLDVVSYNTLLNGCRKGSGSKIQLERVIGLMEANDVQKDARTYNIIIAAYQTLKSSSKVRLYFTEALRVNRANTVTFNTIIKDELSRNHWAVAWSMLQSMQRRQVQRDEASYTPFLHALAKRQNDDQMFELLDMMRNDRVNLSTVSLNILLQRYLEAGQVSDASHLLEYFGNSDAMANEQTFGTIWNFYNKPPFTLQEGSFHTQIKSFVNLQIQYQPGLCKHDLVRKLERMHSGVDKSSPSFHQIRETRSTAGDGFDVEFLEITTLMSAGQYRAALSTYESVVARGISPPMRIFIATLGGLLRHRQYDEAHRITKLMNNQKALRQDKFFQTTMLGVLTSRTAVEDIHKTIKFLESAGTSLDIIFYSAAAWRLYRDDKFHEAISLLCYAFSLGLAFDLVVWMVLIECYAKTRELASTVWCLQTMKDNKVRLDAQARRRIKRTLKTLRTEENGPTIAVAQGLFEDLRRPREPET